MKTLNHRYWFLALVPALSIAADTNKLVDNPQVVSVSGVNKPDESILWALFHANKSAALNKQLADLKLRYPNWQLPIDLLNAMQAKGVSKIKSSRQKRSGGVADSCSNLDKRWLKAEQLLQLQHVEKALQIYQIIIKNCADKELAATTLAKASSALNPDDFQPLYNFAADYLPADYLAKVNYQRLKNHYLSQAPQNITELQSKIVSLKPQIEVYQDTDFADLIAWQLFDFKDYVNSHDWFELADRWRVESKQPSGRLLTLEKQGQYDRALSLYATVTQPSTDLQAIAARLYKLKAWQAIKDTDVELAEAFTSKAETVEPSDSEVTALRAWIANAKREYAEAAKLFDSLYKQSPSKQYAAGYVLNQAEIEPDSLKYKALLGGRLMLDEYNNLKSTELYNRKQFLAAHQASSTAYPNLANIDSPFVDIGVYGRHKVGEAGTSRLDMLRMPVATGSYTVDGVHNFKLAMSRVALDSGGPSQCKTLLGALSPTVISGCSTSNAINYQPISELNDGVELDLMYRMDGWLSPFAKIGTTPLGAVIEPTITFDLGFIQQTKFGNWSFDVYSQSIRQSILSYIGISDPYSSGIPNQQQVNSLNALGFRPNQINAIQHQNQWGRVLREGIRASLYYQFNKQWGISTSADAAKINGVNVDDNVGINAAVSLGRNFDIDGFDYFTVGPALMYEHYEKNLSHFTLGHGGYFSPKHYYNLGLGLNFLTDEGKDWVVKGRVSGGAQMVNEANAPWFPLIDPSIGAYAGGNTTSYAMDLELKGVWLVAPNWQLGAGAGIRNTANYQDYTGGLFVRFFFNDRKASYSTDIPDTMFNTMQNF